MGFRAYLKASLIDYLLCVLLSVATSSIIFYGFYVSPDLQFNSLLTIGFCAAVLVCVFLAGYNKRTTLVGTIALATIAVVALVLVVVLSGGSSVLSDSEDNPAVYFMVLSIVSLAVFLLSRQLWGLAVLTTLVVFSTALVEFLYDFTYITNVAAMLLALGCLCIYRAYLIRLRKTATKKAVLLWATVTALVCCVVAFAGAFGIYAVVIEPLNPPAQEVKLFVRYYALEELYVRGTNAELAITDPNLTTALINEQVEEVKEEDQPPDAQQEPDDYDPTAIPKTMRDMQALATNSVNGLQDFFYNITHNLPDWTYPVLLGILVLVVVGVVFLKRLLRVRWYAKIRKLPAAEQVKQLYRFYLERFRRLRIVRPQQTTLREFAKKSASKMIVFADNKLEVPFFDLTLIYEYAGYGDQELDEETIKPFHVFHDAFYHNCLTYLGRFRYCLKYFRL
jgi:hypothetical protein